MTPLVPQTRSGTSARRGGRPTAEQAGEVDRRILDAATDLFLERGFDATSCDQVSVRASAGKASLYARYANKEALFTAVVHRMIDRTVRPLVLIPWHAPARERLRVAGLALLAQVLVPDAVALMRVVITTAHRLPDLAHLMDQAGRAGGVRCIAEAIAGANAPPERIDRASALADRFIEMAFVPLQMRALFGEMPAALQAAATQYVDDAIDLLAGTGHLNRWDVDQ